MLSDPWFAAGGEDGEGLELGDGEEEGGAGAFQGVGLSDYSKSSMSNVVSDDGEPLTTEEDGKEEGDGSESDW